MNKGHSDAARDEDVHHCLVIFQKAKVLHRVEKLMSSFRLRKWSKVVSASHKLSKSVEEQPGMKERVRHQNKLELEFWPLWMYTFVSSHTFENPHSSGVSVQWAEKHLSPWCKKVAYPSERRTMWKHVYHFSNKILWLLSYQGLGKHSA